MEYKRKCILCQFWNTLAEHLDSPPPRRSTPIMPYQPINTQTFPNPLLIQYFEISIPPFVTGRGRGDSNYGVS